MYSNWNAEVAENKKTSGLLKSDQNTNQGVFDVLQMEDWLEDFGEKTGFGDILCYNFLFRKSLEHEDLFLTFLDYNWRVIEELYKNARQVRRFVGAQNNAEHLTNSLIDDSLPYEDKSMKYHFFPSGRIENARLIGDIRYHEAIDNLIEAGVHDDSRYMRAECFESLGKMKEGAFDKAELISEGLFSEKMNWVRMEIAKSLGDIGNPIALGVMRECIEDMLHYIDYHVYLDMTGNWDRKTEEYPLAFIWAFQNLLTGIFKLDDYVGREVFDDILSYGDDSAIHFAYNAVSLCGPGISKKSKIKIPSVSEIRKYG